MHSRECWCADCCAMEKHMIEVTHPFENVYVLRDRAGCCANLVTGREKALLFDTGSGTGDMGCAVRKITGLPLVVINSHGHFDHIGGNHQFDTVYMHPDDFIILKSYTPELLERWKRELAGRWEKEGAGQQKEHHYPPVHGLFHEGRDNIKALDFDKLDLGGLECRIIPLPGHSRGSVGIWLPKLRLLLSGDALTPVMCLIFQNHMPSEVQYKTLKYVQAMDFDWYLTSHHSRCFSKALISRLIRCIENSTKGKWHAYRYPYPPYAEGKIYLDSLEEEPVALICDEGPAGY